MTLGSVSAHTLLSSLLGFLLAGTSSAFPSIAQVKRDTGEATKAQHETSGARAMSWSYITSTYVITDTVTSTSTYSSVASGSDWYYTTTYIATDLSTVTTVIIGPTDVRRTPNPTCEYSRGETVCGNLCCPAGQYCESSGTCKEVGGGGGSEGCSNPCGYYGQVCCAEGELCSTKAENQAQCVPSNSGGCAIPCGFDRELCCSAGEMCWIETSMAQCVPTTSSTCPLSTTVYTTTSSYESTVLDTITVVVTRVESGMETIIRTAVFSPYPQLCLAEFGQTQCGDVYCGQGQFCQSAGVCASQGCPPLRPTSESLVTITTDFVTTIPFQAPVATSS